MLWAAGASVGADLIVHCAHLSQYSELGSTNPLLDLDLSSEEYDDVSTD